IPKGFSCGQFPSIWKPSGSVHKKDIESTDGGLKQLNGALRDIHRSVCLSRKLGVSKKPHTLPGGTEPERCRRADSNDASSAPIS
ncbi:MAG: hypothetical protein ACI4CT_07935, partial [Lachnospiraceae bacterium]